MVPLNYDQGNGRRWGACIEEDRRGGGRIQYGRRVGPRDIHMV